jgi:hypothetical protein
MSVLKSDGLTLKVEDGSSPGQFHVLRGVTISRLDITQRLHDNTAIAGDGWLVSHGVSERRCVVECDVLATDEFAATRLYDLAVGDVSGNFEISIRPEQYLQCTAFVTQYREIIQPGEIKRLQLRLESSGVVSLV